MRDVVIAITAASYSGNKGAAAMLQSSIRQLHKKYGQRLNINLMSVYPKADREQVPWDFVKIVSCKPEQLLFIAFPLSILYWLFRWCPPIRWLLLKNKILKAYKNTDMVLDEAGISFVDSRGFIMNTYAFVCAAVPLMMGVPVVKYSQAMGTFKNPWNRFLAKWILPKLSLICARGQITYDNLAGIGIKDNVKLCADGAFTMEDEPAAKEMVDKVKDADDFYSDAAEKLVGLSLSSVVEKKCTKLGIDYAGIMADFIRWLNGEGYKVLIIANAARIESEKTRNNDLMVCDKIYDSLEDKSMTRWYHKEMDAEEIREYIGSCRFLVASRFHSMIGSLEKKVPVLLIGWSHKYKEVLDFFELGQYAIDFTKLDLEDLKAAYKKFVEDEDTIRANMDKNFDSVMASSRLNIQYTSEVIDQIMEKPYKKGKKILDYKDPGKYVGEYQLIRKGYASDETIRANAASGGEITALLCYALKTGYIDGALVSKTYFENGELKVDTHIATTEEDIRDCSSSIYMDFPIAKCMDQVKAFNGKVAVIAVPCMIRAITALCERDKNLADKVVLKMGLYCSGNHDKRATTLSMEKSGVTAENAERLYYRRGHWRGQSAVIYKDGSEKAFSYTKTICAYKNAYFYEKASCMVCQDHYAFDADISFGDIWLKEMKANPIKHSSCVIRTDRARELYENAVKDGVLVESHLSGRDLVRSQKRALVFKFTCAPAKIKYFKKKNNTELKLEASDKCKWNQKLAYYLARKNEDMSHKKPGKVEKLPTWFVYYYMCFIRVLLSF